MLTCSFHGEFLSDRGTCPYCEKEFGEYRQAGKLSPKIPVWTLEIYQRIKLLRQECEEDGCSEEQIRKAIDDYIEVEAKRQKEHTEFEERCKREQRKRLAREKENAYFGV